MNSLQPSLFQILKWLLHYIKGTIFYGIYISPRPFTLMAYYNADWDGDFIDHCSTTGFCIFLSAILISQKFTKQKIIIRSSTKVKYHVMATTTIDIIWLHYLIQEFDIPLSSPTLLFYDNLFAISLAINLIFHTRTKHVEIYFHFVWGYIQRV